jgi:hypothetical protein
MITPPEHWKPHEIAAYRAWQSGDLTGLVKACDRVITSFARGFARSSRLGSDELHPRQEAESKDAGLHEARQVAAKGLQLLQTSVGHLESKRWWASRVTFLQRLSVVSFPSLSPPWKMAVSAGLRGSGAIEG